MRLPAVALVGVLALTACGDPSATSLAKQACHSLDLNTGVAIPPGTDDPPGLEKMTAQAARAAKKSPQFRALASAMAAFTETNKRQDPLFKNGFDKMTPSQKSQYDALEQLRESQYETVAAECKKVRAGS